jgi:hypothetical protein
VKLERIRSGERMALAGAVGLAVLLGFDWFYLSTPDARLGAHESGIRALGWFAELLLVAAILLALAMAATTAFQRAVAWPLVLSVFALLFGIAGTLAVAIRLIAQPSLGVDAGNADVELEPAAWLGLAAIIAIAAGAWRALTDERTDTAEAREQTEEVLRVRGAPRPAPPRHAESGGTRPDPLAE